MLERFFSGTLDLGVAQAVVATVLALVVVLLARRRAVHLEKESLVGLVRGFVQVVAVGSVLVLVFQGPSLLAVLVLLAMMAAAAATSASRARRLSGAFRVSLYGIVGGAGVVIAVMTAAGVIDSRMTSLIPVGSMVIAAAMNSNALALERFRSELRSNVGYVEAGLSLGAAPERVVRPYVQAAVRAAMIPRIDTLRSLGIVWIPGLMAGMILAGSDPVYAAIYQFVVIAMIYSSSGLTSLISTLLMRGHAFTGAEQLALEARRG